MSDDPFEYITPPLKVVRKLMARNYPESESGCPYVTIGKLKDEIDRLRAENERLWAAAEAYFPDEALERLRNPNIGTDGPIGIEPGVIEKYGFNPNKPPDPPQETGE